VTIPMYIISLSSSVPVPVPLSDASSFSSGISSPFAIATCARNVAISGARTGIGSGRSEIVNFEREANIALREEGLSEVECNGKGTTALSAS
jgi:hypothetical protein